MECISMYSMASKFSWFDWPKNGVHLNEENFSSVLGLWFKYFGTMVFQIDSFVLLPSPRSSKKYSK
ncbi:hypothetical protein CFP56_010844 [Quercus suber]|uniref:Uncharacterized protein n=1 Tax=Quercus suber TaxID=58331 RepID=A0AAW0KXX9_QUESU